MSHPLGAAFSLTVGIIASILSLLGYAAYRRSLDSRILFVTAAFGVFGLKGILTFVEWKVMFAGHNAWEIVTSAADLVVVLLLVAPFLKK